MSMVYPIPPEGPITRADIDRLTVIIEQLNDAMGAAADREDTLRHKCDVQRARAEVAEALARPRLQTPIGEARRATTVIACTDCGASIPVTITQSNDGCSVSWPAKWPDKLHAWDGATPLVVSVAEHERLRDD